MGNLRACLVVALSALAGACGDDGNTVADASVDSAPDSKIFLDAPPPMFDLTCIGNSPATPATTVTLSGKVQQGDINLSTFMFMITPIGSATVKACDTAACNGPSDGSDVTDNAGDFSIAPITTGGTAVDDYLMMTKSGVRTTLVYPHAPFVADQAGIPILTFGSTATSLLNNLDGCDTAEPLIAVAVTDCANSAITDTANVNITVKQNGTPVAGAKVHDLSTVIPNAPAEIAGLFLICSVPANNATILSATYYGMYFLAIDVKTAAARTTTTQLRPGY
jgi:hypothetical protein